MKYKLDRRKFIEYVDKYEPLPEWMSNVKEDLIKGGEFIFTAQDLLDSCLDEIPGELLVPPISYIVSSEDCELIYIQDES